MRKFPLYKNKNHSFYCGSLLCRHRLIFPGRFQPSIVSTDELNYRVRDGNGWTLIAKNTDYRMLFVTSVSFSVAYYILTKCVCQPFFANFLDFFEKSFLLSLLAEGLPSGRAGTK